jgi:hypothetical protein
MTKTTDQTPPQPEATTEIILPDTPKRHWWQIAKPRSLQDLSTDAEFAYRFGLMNGAIEAYSNILEMHEDPSVQRIGERLGYIASWYKKNER